MIFAENVKIIGLKEMADLNDMGGLIMLIRSPDNALEIIWQKIPRHIKLTFFSAFIIGILTHAFMLTNKLPNHDDVGWIFHPMRMPWFGRWFLSFAVSLGGNFSMPWVNGILSVIYISVTACLVVSLLQIKQTVHCILASALMMTFPTVACTFSYMALSQAYFFSLLLAALAAYAADRFRFGFLLAAVFITLSLGIYQAYYGVAAGLMVGALIVDLLKDGAPVKLMIGKGLKFVISLALGLMMYFAVVKLTTMDGGLSNYQNIDAMGRISPSLLLRLIGKSYSDTVSFFCNRGVHFRYMPSLFLVAGIMVSAFTVLIIKALEIRKDKNKTALLCLLLLLFPLAANFITVMNPEDIHMLMVYGFVILLVMMLSVMEICLSLEAGFNAVIQGFSRVAGWLLCLIVMLVVHNYALVSNQGYFRLFFTYEQGYAYSVTLLARIQGIDGYAKGKRVVFVGRPDRAGVWSVPPKRENQALTGMLVDIPSISSYKGFLEKYLGYNQGIVWLQNIEQLHDFNIFEPVADMPVYPDAHSVKVMNDLIVVKFSDLD